MEDDPVLSPEEAPGPKFSLFQVATTGIIVLMAATTAISWYFIRKRQVEQEGASPSAKAVAERPKEEGDRIARLEKKIAELEEKLTGMEIQVRQVQTSPGTTHMPDLRVVPTDKPPEGEGAQVEEAHHDFAAGKYKEAENGYFRAIFLYPDSLDANVGLALCALVRGAYAEGWSILSRILRRNPDFLKEAGSPLLFFGSEEEYRKYRDRLQAHLGENPLDAEAKLLKAWLEVYEKGGNYGKSLASELPGNPDAGILIQQIDSSGK